MKLVPERSAFFDLADRLVECVRDQLRDPVTEEPLVQAGDVDRASVVVGAELVWDNCDCGLLAVQLIRTYPSQEFPVIKQGPPFGACDVNWMVAEYHVSILRCVAPAGVNGEPPPALSMHEDAMHDFEDRWAVLRGVVCCLAATHPDNPAMRNYLLGEQLALGEGGMCAGSRLQVFVALPNCVECDVP